MTDGINMKDYLIQNEQYLTNNESGKNNTDGNLSDEEISVFFSRGHLQNVLSDDDATITQEEFNTWYSHNEGALNSYLSSINLDYNDESVKEQVFSGLMDLANDYKDNDLYIKNTPYDESKNKIYENDEDLKTTKTTKVKGGDIKFEPNSSLTDEELANDKVKEIYDMINTKSVNPGDNTFGNIISRICGYDQTESQTKIKLLKMAYNKFGENFDKDYLNTSGYNNRINTIYTKSLNDLAKSGSNIEEFINIKATMDYMGLNTEITEDDLNGIFKDSNYNDYELTALKSIIKQS